MLEYCEDADVLLVEAGRDESPKRARDERHRNVEDEPASEVGAPVMALECLVDVRVHSCEGLRHPYGVVEIKRCRLGNGRDGTQCLPSERGLPS